jgi:translation initiation factor 1
MSVPARPGAIVAKLRMEKKGRGGKMVTVVDGLPNNADFLKELSQELKRACGTGGAVKDGTIELQGEFRDRLRELLAKKGYAVKG